MRRRTAGIRRRGLLLQGWQAAVCASLAPIAQAGAAEGAMPAVLATPGPASAVSLIPELALKIGADAAEGVALRLKFVSGGGIAIREIFDGNAQFGVFGFSAAMNENLRGPRLVALAAVEDRTPLGIMVRADLKGAVRRVEDLEGRVLGIHSNSLATMTNGQQFLMLALRQHQVAPERVRFVATGQSWETESDALRSHTVDAVVSEEPFASRLEREGLAFALLRVNVPDEPAPLPGMGFLRGALLAERRLVDAQPELARRMVRVIQRTLAWRRGHSGPETVAALGLQGAEGEALAAVLERFPDLFSPDARFSAAQLAQTELFFRQSLGNTAAALAYRADSMIDDRWAGRKP